MPARRGKRISRARYAFRRSTLVASDAVDRLARRGSTLMPMVGASLRGILASYEEFSSAGVFAWFVLSHEVLFDCNVKQAGLDDVL